MLGLNKKELAVLRSLTTPGKIQDFLLTLPINHEKKGETCYSPRLVLREKKAHCIEGAFLAATALWLHGEEPLIMDFRTLDYDDDHVVTLFERNGYYGAISKTNHAVARYRDPIYRTLRELALSYFHEYIFPKTGTKTLVSYSKPLNLKRFGTKWITSEKDLLYIGEALDALTHFTLVPLSNRRYIRPGDAFEIKMGDYIEWPKSDPRT